jgi:restriction endonuclease Mrr
LLPFAGLIGGIITTTIIFQSNGESICGAPVIVLIGLGLGFAVSHGVVLIGNWLFRHLNKYEKAVEDAKVSYKEAIWKYEQKQLRKEKEFWLHMSGSQFERELGRMFEQAGYEVEYTGAKGDKGIDLVLRRGSEKIVVQCKAHRKPVGPSTARDLYGAMIDAQAQSAILASLSGVTVGIYQFIQGKTIKVMDLSDIVQMGQQLAKYPEGRE